MLELIFSFGLPFCIYLWIMFQHVEKLEQKEQIRRMIQKIPKSNPKTEAPTHSFWKRMEVTYPHWVGIPFFIYSLISAALMYFVGELFFQSMPLALVVSLIGLSIPYVLHKRKEREYCSIMDEQFPNVLDRLLASIRVGQTMVQAVEELVDQESIHPLVRREFALVCDDVKARIPIDRALQNEYQRIPSMHIRRLADLIQLTQQKGGNLVALLSSIQHRIVANQELVLAKKNATSEKRLEANFFLSLPILALLLFRFVKQEEFDQLVMNGGWIFVLISFLCIGFGYLLITNIAKLKD